MSYKDELISLSKVSGESLNDQKRMAKELIDVELHYNSLDSARSKKLLKKIEELGGYTKAKDFIKKSAESEQSAIENEDSPSYTEASESNQKSGAVATGSATAASSFQLKEVYDAESGELIQRTPEQQAIGHAMYNRMKQVEALQWAMVKLFVENDHHLDLGYSRRADFYAAEFGLGVSAAQKRLKAGEFLLGLLPVSAHKQIQEAKEIKGLSADEVKNFNSLANLGTSKLSDMARIDEADFTEVLSDGVVKFSDGREVALEDIQLRTRTELNNLFKAEIDSYKKRNANLLDAKSESEAEIKRLREEKELLDDKIADADRKELLYGPKETSLKGYYQRVEMATKAVRDANKIVTTIKLPADAPDDLQMNVQALHKIIDGGRQVLFDNNYSAIEGAAETRPTTLASGDVIDDDTGEILEEAE